MRRMQAMQMHYATYGMDAVGRPLRRARRITVRQWEQGLLFRHGRLEGVVDPGAHRRWRSGYTLRTVDLRPWIVLVPTQEIPTADGATVKITVAGQARVANPTAYVTAARDADEALYLAVQVALREVVAVTSIDELLTGRQALGSRLLAAVGGLDAVGVALDQLEIKDVILPGELKRAQAEVLVARAQGTAALERARGETAALRNLANAARMAADNPALVQLRLLQQLDASSGHTVVIGSPPLGGVRVGGDAQPTAAARRRGRRQP